MYNLQIIFPYADDTDFNREQSDFSGPFFHLLYSASSFYFKMYFLGLVTNWDLD